VTYRNALKTFVAWLFVLYIYIVLAFPAYGQSAQFDPRIAETVRVQSERFPAPEGCFVVGGWEDGSIVAYCELTQLDYFIAHGPDANDVWMSYDGPLMPVWIERALSGREDF
jgi:hypothetical protein